MSRLTGRKPSPALIVAVIALVAALGGTAVGGIGSTAKLTKKEKRQIKRIAKNKANKQIKKKGPGLSVASSDDAAKLGGVGPNGYTTQSAGATLDGTIALTGANQNIVETEITVPAARTITAIASVEADADGADDDFLNCNINIAGTDGVRFTANVPDDTFDSSGTMALNHTLDVPAGTHTVLVECAEGVISSVEVDGASLSVIATG